MLANGWSVFSNPPPPPTQKIMHFPCGMLQCVIHNFLFYRLRHLKLLEFFSHFLCIHAAGFDAPLLQYSLHPLLYACTSH